MVRYRQTVQPRARRRSLVRFRRHLVLRVVFRHRARAGFEFGRGGGAVRWRPRGEGRVHVRLVRLFVQSLYRTLLGARLLSLRLFLRGILPETCLRGGSSFLWGGGGREWRTLERVKLTFWKLEESLVHSASATCVIPPPPSGESSQGDSSISCISMKR